MKICDFHTWFWNSLHLVLTVFIQQTFYHKFYNFLTYLITSKGFGTHTTVIFPNLYCVFTSKLGLLQKYQLLVVISKSYKNSLTQAKWNSTTIYLHIKKLNKMSIL